MKPWKRSRVKAALAEPWALQWGHGDEAVEERRHRRVKRRRRWLQWGHGDEAVEELGRRVAGVRPERGFNGAKAMKPWKRPTAATTCWRSGALQWGHGDEAVEEFPRRSWACPRPSSFNGATAMKPWKRATIDSWMARQCALQWGHGDEAVEEGPSPGPFGAKDLGPGLREGRPAGVLNRSRARAMKS